MTLHNNCKQTHTDTHKITNAGLLSVASVWARWATSSITAIIVAFTSEPIALQAIGHKALIGMVKDISLPSAIAFNTGTACTFDVFTNIPKKHALICSTKLANIFQNLIHNPTFACYRLQNSKLVLPAYILVQWVHPDILSLIELLSSFIFWLEHIIPTDMKITRVIACSDFHLNIERNVLALFNRCLSAFRWSRSQPPMSFETQLQTMSTWKTTTCLVST